MLTFTKTKNTRLPDSVHNAGVTAVCLLSLFIQSKDQNQNKVQELQIKELEFKLKTKELEDKLVS
jgi:hypothetical protein